MSTDDGDMTPPEDQLPSSDGGPVDEAVVAFTYRMSGGEDVDLQSFVADYPADLRDEIERLCRQARSVHRAMEGSSSGALAAVPGPPGRIGPFTLGRLLGRGGMAEVYLATEDDSGRQVALKLLHLAPDESGRAEARFRREAHTAARLEHPGIAAVDSIHEQEGLLAIAMEYVPGLSLARILRDEYERRHRGGGELGEEPAAGPSDGSTGREGEAALEQSARTSGAPDIDAAGAATMIAAVAEALEHAHSQGVIHRDIKPSNIMIDEQGQPHVLDFGLAKDVRELSISRQGDLAGTPAYMSPEQAMAKRVRVDHRTDVFSLGVVLYEALTLRRPFTGDSVDEVLYEISFAAPAPVIGFNAEVPADLETICLKALEKNPADRYASAGSLALDLRRFVAHRSIDARRPSWFVLAQRRLMRHRWAAALVLLATLLLGAAVPFAGWWSRREQVTQGIERAEAILRADLAARSPEALVAECEALGLLLADFPELPSDQRQPIEQAVTHLRRYGRGEFEAGMAEIEQAFAGAAAATPYQSMPLFTSSVRRLMTAAMLLPDDEDLQRMVASEAWLPRLTVSSDQPGDRVLLQRLGRVHHMHDGPPKELGTTPLPLTLVEPGVYRVLVVRDGVGHGEFLRRLEVPRQITRLDVIVRPDIDVSADMVTIESGEFVAGYGTEADDPLNFERHMTLPPFQIDAFEVSNAKYRAFVLATGHRAPLIWPEPYDALLDDLPVVMVDRADATTYAAWAGKRLPTLWEWERAARGTDGAAYPVDPAAMPLDRYAMGRPINFSAMSDPEGFTDAFLVDYLNGVMTVNSLPEARSAAGLFHVYGNAQEWVETSMTEFVPGVGPVVHAELGMAKGGSWNFDTGVVTLLHSTTPPRDVREPGMGFRCARSLMP